MTMMATKSSVIGKKTLSFTSRVGLLWLFLLSSSLQLMFVVAQDAAGGLTGEIVSCSG
jgi:hypothetical protein